MNANFGPDDKVPILEKKQNNARNAKLKKQHQKQKQQAKSPVYSQLRHPASPYHISKKPKTPKKQKWRLVKPITQPNHQTTHDESQDIEIQTQSQIKPSTNQKHTQTTEDTVMEEQSESKTTRP